MSSLIPGTTTDSSTNGSPRRKVLATVVGTILQEVGFHNAEKAAVGTLTEMLQSLLVEIGRTSYNFAEIAYRTEPVVADIQLAFADLGLNIEGIQAYAKKNRLAISLPSQQADNKQHNILQVGDKQNHPSHIPEHFPSFPDTHTYCFSHTYKQPVTEYEAIREKSAQQKRDIEKALTKYAIKTNYVTNLFMTDDKEFLLIDVKPEVKPYLDALMPRDQVFEEDEEYEAKLRKRRKMENGEETETKEKEKDVPEETQNPFLRPIKMPRKKLKMKNV